MLRELRIRSLGVIDSAVLEPSPGLSVVTGETGAGKTMIVSGLSLISGGRAGAGMVRSGEAKAVVDAAFSDVTTALAAAVEETGGDLDDGELLVCRHITASRSRAFAGGVAVPVQTAARLVEDLITIHGQSEQVRLGSPERQREVLDIAAGPEHQAVLDRYREHWDRRRALVDELEQLRGSERERAREADLLRFGIQEIDAVAPEPAEDDTLAAESRRLQATDDLRLAAHTAAQAVRGDEDALEAPGALGLLAVGIDALRRAPGEDPQLEALGTRLRSVSEELGDVSAELSRYLADLDADPARLEHVAARLADLQRLTRKYGASVDEVLGWAHTSRARLQTLEGSDERIDELAALVEELDARLDEDASALSEARREAAERLSDLAETELASLALPRARLRFDIAPGEPSRHGTDEIRLLFSANPGAEPGPLGKVASGGELSRVRLALEVVLAAGDPGHTFVFDEVDAGVGGATATEIGRRLARLAEHSQVLVVTHLAQVAAFADAHFVVTKSSDGQVTRSGVTRVEDGDRIAELARMMGGRGDADSARAHARELRADALGGRAAAHDSPSRG